MNNMNKSDKDARIYAVLLVFFSWFGVHKFWELYTSYPKKITH